MEIKNNKKTVFVGLSGGVDSSVSAALLKDQGYNVVGVFIKAWEPDGYDCGWRDERRDAMRVSATLDIPFLTIDLSREYKKEVVDYMISEYQAGRTPNPDVMCNKSIKFGVFFKRAMEAGADFVATGHYSRVREVRSAKCKVKSRTQNSKYQMLAGIDDNKDQTYFLWTLGQDQLAKTLFPIGGIKKDEVRKLAEKFNLLTFDKKDSQGICFVGKLDLKEFLKGYIKEKPGEVLDVQGKKIGTHSGALFFTLGERHGFIIDKKTPDEKPYYVIAKDIDKNTITVSHEPLFNINNKEVIIESINWQKGEKPDLVKKYQARIRYRQPLEECELKEERGQIKVIFTKPQTAITPGQSLVVYDGDICLGGGIIS